MECKLNIFQYLIGAQVFFFVWIVATLAIRESDISINSIPKIMVNTMVKEGTFVLGLHDSKAGNPRGDLVAWKGKILPWKQPGIGIIGSMPIYSSRILGLFYDDLTEYAIAAAFSSSVSTAVISALIFLLLVREFSVGSSIFCSMVVGLCSTLTVYSGTIHHDPVASMLIFLAYYLFQVSDLGKGIFKLCIPAFLLGFSTFISLLPIGINSILFLYMVLRVDKLRHKLLLLLFGLIFGLLPILIYQWYYFDSPLNTAGHIYSITNGTQILSSWNVFYQRFLAYFIVAGTVNLYVFNPLLVLAVVGMLIEVIWNKSNLREFSLLLLCAILGHALYMIFIGGGNTISPLGYGDCQYGPRYWMAPIPFMSLGLALLFRVQMHNPIKILFYYSLGLLFLWSMIVNQVGLHFGHTYCGTTLAKQFFDYFNLIISRKNEIFPIRGLIYGQIITLATCIVLFVFFRFRGFLRTTG